MSSFGTGSNFEPTNVVPTAGASKDAGKFEWRQVDDTDEFDPWGSSFPDEQEPTRVRPNWWIVATGVLGFLVVVLASLILFRGGDDEASPTPALGGSTTVASDGSSSSSSSSVESEGSGESISSVIITETVAPAACLTASQGGGGQPLQAFLNAALSQQGTPYEFGAVAGSDDLNPASFDTSELVKWAAARAGVEIVDGSWLQYQALSDCGSTVTVEEALTIPGALVFGFPSEPTGDERPSGAFVAISLGSESRIIDVKPDGGVAIAPASSRTLTHATLIPNLGKGDAEFVP